MALLTLLCPESFVRCSRSQASSATMSGTTAFIAHRKSLLCRQAVALALDGKQLVDAFDGLDRDRRLGEADEIEEVVPQHATSTRPR